MTETGVRESRDGVTQVEVMVEGKSHDDSNTGTPIVRGNRVNTSKSKVTGQKRKRYCLVMYRLPFLKYNWKKVIWTDRRVDRKLLIISQRTLRIMFLWRESTNGFVITRVRRRGGEKGGRVVLKVRDMRHVTHGEIVLFTNDDGIVA